MQKHVLAAALSSLLVMSTAHAEQLPPDRVFASPPISGPTARGVALSPDGKAVTYIKTKADDLLMADLWIADVAGGEPRLLIDGRKLAPEAKDLSEAEKARRERAGVSTRGVIEYQWDEQGRFILAPVEGDLWLYEMASGQARQLTATPGDEIDAKVSPRGGFVSFVRDFNLYVLPAAGGAEKAITTGGADLKFYAMADFLADEELDRQTGYWWSPDEKRIALTFVDETGVDVVERPDVGPTGAVIVAQRYPRPGRPNPTTELYIANLSGGERVKVDLGASKDIYVARVNWSADGKTLYVQRLSRDQRRLDLLAVDPDTGAARTVLTEQSEHWIELTHDFKPLKDGRFLWTSERSGYRHVYLHGADGKQIAQITRGDWPVDKIEGVDEARGVLFFTGYVDKPIEKRLYEVSFKAPGAPRALTAAGGWWNPTLAKSGKAFVATFDNPATPPQTALYRADGTRVRWIEENALKDGHPFWPYAERLRQPSFGTIKADDGQDLWWSMRTPPGFDAAKRYPVIVQVYGGPGAGMVTANWMAPEDQLLLDAGYILFRLDNRGSPHRSVAFKTAIDRKMGQREIDDQFAGARYLKTLPFVSPDRIGITGGSYGGYMTLLAMTAQDSPFAAGAAFAPVTDWALYDTAYTERYMGTPADNPEGYKATEVVSRLDDLRPGTVLISHGMADDNVTFDHTTRVLFDLQARGVQFETMVYPGLRHRGGWTPKNRQHRAMLTLDFFDRKLKAP